MVRIHSCLFVKLVQEQVEVAPQSVHTALWLNCQVTGFTNIPQPTAKDTPGLLRQLDNSHVDILGDFFFYRDGI